jgi:hypothetical protein
MDWTATDTSAAVQDASHSEGSLNCLDQFGWVRFAKMARWVRSVKNGAEVS